MYSDYFDRPNYLTTFKTETGEIVAYDACGKKRNSYNPAFFEFIGTGKIYSVDGAVQSQTDEEPMYFFRRK